MADDQPRKNIARRVVGVALCTAPILLAVLCILWPRELPPAREWFGLVLVSVAGLLGCWNLYLAYGRPWLYVRRHASRAGYRFVSGLPVVGTLLQVGACVMAFGSPVVGGCALLAALIDPDGLPWFPVHTWRDGSLWDG